MRKIKKQIGPDGRELRHPDGGNHYQGKTRENSKIFCKLCREYGCICVRPSKTDEDLRAALENRIHYGRISLDPDRKKLVPHWERRLAAL